MELKNLEARMYFLAGQLEEAKNVYKNAVGEMERVNKEQANRSTETTSSGQGSTVSMGEPAQI